MGISRDDAGEFIPKHKEEGIFEVEPFKTIDQESASWLLHLVSAAKGRFVNPDLSLSVCGEHGVDAKSIEFFHKVWLGLCCVVLSIPRFCCSAGCGPGCLEAAK